MVAELDEGGCARVAGSLGKDETDAAVAAGIGQDLVPVIGIGARHLRAVAVERHNVTLDGDAVRIGGIAGPVIGGVFLGGLVALLGLAVHDRRQGAVLQQGIDRLPVACIVGQGAVLDLIVVEIAVIDGLCLGAAGMGVIVVMIVVVGVVMRGWGGTLLGQRRPGQGKRRSDQQTGGEGRAEGHGAVLL